MTTVCDSTVQKELRPDAQANDGEAKEVVEGPTTAESVRAKSETFKAHCKHDSGSYEDMLSGKVTSCSSHGSNSSSSGCGSSGVGSPAQNHQAPVAVTVIGESLANHSGKGCRLLMLCKHWRCCVSFWLVQTLH